ncbi:hypothetical protein [Halorubrum sp. CBA1229]|uniref:hypothetical protein n=1 Tax=Halorubrum sp. CBA1229 TaxID=1853699 RepID=UPI000F3AF9FC|nr:hypothetical protein [Halorubrum sp. CBA1229]QKY16484.1 hypothetical protein Hrr1229_006160 [Halorubrum sp. CBA1229]
MPSTDRRPVLTYIALAMTGLVGADLAVKATESRDEPPSWGPPVEGGHGDWAIIDEDTDRVDDEGIDATLVLTVQGPNDGSDRFDDEGIRIVSYEAIVDDDDPDWTYTLGRPRLSLRLSTNGAGTVFFSNANAYGDTSDRDVTGRTEIRHAFDAGSGRGAVNPILNYSGPADGDGTSADATMESTVTVPILKTWLRGVGGRIEAGTLRCEITETVTFVG